MRKEKLFTVGKYHNIALTIHFLGHNRPKLDHIIRDDKHITGTV